MLNIVDGIVRRVPRPRLPITEAAQFQGYAPQDLWKAYGFPEGLDGSGVTIGIMEWGSGYSQADMDLFCKTFGLPPCQVIFRSIDGTQQDGGASPADMEGTLDVQWAHAGAPGARIVVYYGASGTTMEEFAQQVHRGFQFVLQDPGRPEIVTVSYGDAERTFGAAACQEWEKDIAALTEAGVMVFVSSGDQGALGMHDVYQDPAGQRNADAPASCPSAIGVGGTKRPVDGSEESVWDESGYGATGGGYSDVFALPGYQKGHVQSAKRGVPDLAALADPFTGYAVIFQGQRQVIGGTSASAPLVAGLFARIVQARKAKGLPPLGDVHPMLYGNPKALRDITLGNNSFFGVTGYDAGPGWDACTGMGVPIGTALLAAFAPDATKTEPKPAPRPAPKPAPKPPHVIVGVDSLAPVTTPFLLDVQEFLGLCPSFWGRYLDVLTPQEAASILSWGIGILPISRYATSANVATALDAQAVAVKTVERAKALGVPLGTTIPVNIDTGSDGPWPVTSAFLNEWAKEMLSANYRPGAYLNAGAPAHMAALAGMDPEMRGQLSVYAGKWQTANPWTSFRRILLFWRRISTPPWAKGMPEGTGVWQFAGNQKPGVDLDLLNLNAEPGVVLWQG